MRLNSKILDEIIEESTFRVETYDRISNLSKEEIESTVLELFKHDGIKVKNLVWIEDEIEVYRKIKNLDQPWVYHYNVNLNWVVLFRTYFNYIINNNLVDVVHPDDFSDLEDIYLKVCCLNKILDNVDGLVEDKNIVYIVKTDFSLIKKDIKKMSLNGRLN